VCTAFDVGFLTGVPSSRHAAMLAPTSPAVAPLMLPVLTAIAFTNSRYAAYAPGRGMQTIARIAFIALAAHSGVHGVGAVVARSCDVLLQTAVGRYSWQRCGIAATTPSLLRNRDNTTVVAEASGALCVLAQVPSDRSCWWHCTSCGCSDTPQ